MRQFTPYLFLLLAASFLYSCKSAKLSDAEEKQRIVDISLSGWQSVTV